MTDCGLLSDGGLDDLSSERRRLMSRNYRVNVGNTDALETVKKTTHFQEKTQGPQFITLHCKEKWAFGIVGVAKTSPFTSLANRPQGNFLTK